MSYSFYGGNKGKSFIIGANYIIDSNIQSNDNINSNYLNTYYNLNNQDCLLGINNLNQQTLLIKINNDYKYLKQPNDYNNNNNIWNLPYNNYFIITDINKLSAYHGCIYKKELNNVCTFIGKIISNMGQEPEIKIETINSGYEIEDSDLIQGKNNNNYNDTINWKSYIILKNPADNNSIDTVYLKFTIPYSIIDMAVNYFRNLNNISNNTIQGLNPVKRSNINNHKFYHIWDAEIPFFPHGEEINNITINTPEINNNDIKINISSTHRNYNNNNIGTTTTTTNHYNISELYYKAGENISNINYITTAEVFYDTTNSNFKISFIIPINKIIYTNVSSYSTNFIYQIYKTNLPVVANNTLKIVNINTGEQTKNNITNIQYLNTGLKITFTQVNNLTGLPYFGSSHLLLPIEISNMTINFIGGAN